MSDYQPSAELRAAFETDARTIMAKVEGMLPALTIGSPDFEQLEQMSSAVHGLRGAAALVGGSGVAILAADLERLLEIASSFRYGALEKAREILRLVNEIYPALRKTLQHTLADRTAEAQRCQSQAHQRILAEWGDYFYEGPAAENQNPASSAGASSATVSPASVEVRTKPRSGSNTEVARRFLESLGVHPHQPLPPAAMPEPAITQGAQAQEGDEQTGKPGPRPCQQAGGEPKKTTTVSGAQDAPGLGAISRQPKGRPTRVEDSGRLALNFLQSLGVPMVAPDDSGVPPECPETAGTTPAGPAEPPEVLKAVSGPVTTGKPAVVEAEVMSFFLQELEETLEQLDARLQAWERKSEDRDTTYAIYRLVHSIKGAAHSVGLGAVGRLLHELEDVLEQLVEAGVPADRAGLLALINEVMGTVRVIAADAQKGVLGAAADSRLKELGDKISVQKQALSAAGPVGTEDVAGLPGTAAETAVPDAVSAAPAPLAETQGAQTVRVELWRLDLLMNLVGELVINRTRLEKKIEGLSRLKDEWQVCRSRLLQEMASFQDAWMADGIRRRTKGTPAATGLGGPPPNIGINSGLLRPEPETEANEEASLRLRTLLEATTDAREIFGLLTRRFDSVAAEAAQCGKITTQLQEEMTRVRMVPVAGLLRRLLRVARDAATQEGKSIDFQTIGGETRLDKAILDRVYRPLLHVVRNAVSHGVEEAETRQRLGKPAAGRVQLNAFYEASQLVIEITDDGRGLDYEKIQAEAIRRGLLQAGSQPRPEELTHLIFTPGFSTANRTSEVSGRGVGMDVVRQEIGELNGTVHLLSETDKGCTVVIRLPLTLSILQAMLVQVSGETLALPLNFIERIRSAEGLQPKTAGPEQVVVVEGELLPWVPLRQVLGLGDAAATRGELVVARIANRRVAFQIDRVLQKQDVVVKPVRSWFLPRDFYAGATVNGEGRVLLIANLPGLLEAARATPVAEVTAAAGHSPTVQPEVESPASVLVVDDSLSVRKVMEQHLKALGYAVTLAVDGADALEKLHAGTFALVVTDLDMPRMHGFELLAEIRQQPALRKLPVFVVTSCGGVKHRRRAAELGCSAYLTKPVVPEELAAQIQRVLGGELAQTA